MKGLFTEVVWDWTKALLIAVVITLIIRTFFFSPIIVDGSSMSPTLQHRDQIFMNKIHYRFKNIERFDIVVFHTEHEKDFIKRVIGLPGEHVMYENNHLYINGELVEEPFLTEGSDNLMISFTEDFTLEDLPGNYDQIPEGYVFVLGDNRQNSRDSRSIGLVPIEKIVGKASFTYWPIHRIRFMKGV